MADTARLENRLTALERQVFSLDIAVTQILCEGQLMLPLEG